MRSPAPVVEVSVALAVLTGTSPDAGCGGIGGGGEIGGVLDLDVCDGVLPLSIVGSLYTGSGGNLTYRAGSTPAPMGKKG